MRPALHANILRNRNQRAHRINSPPRPHTFSMTRLLLMVLIGAIIFIPGIALTVLGFQNKDEVTTNTPAATLTMYRAIGPTAGAIGIGVLFGSCVYYYCYGMTDGRPHKSHQGSMNSSDHTGTYAYSSVRGGSNKSHHHGSGRSHTNGSAPHSPSLGMDAHTHRIHMTDFAPLAASESASVKEVPSAVPSEISLSIEGAHGIDYGRAPPGYGRTLNGQPPTTLDLPHA